MEKITIHYTPSIYLEAQRIHYRAQKSYWFYKIFFTLAFCFFGFFFILNIIQGRFDLWTFSFLIFSAIYVFYEWTLLPMVSKNLYKKQKMFEGAVEISFGKDFIEEKTCISEGRIQHVYQYKLKNNLLLIYITPATFIVVPKKFCIDDAQFDRIVDIVSNFPQG